MWLSVKQIEERGCGSAATIWRRVKARTFPQPVKLSPGMTRWKLSDIEAWETQKESQINAGA